MSNQTINIVLNKSNKLLFFIVLFELFLGGGGRLTEFGFLTLRMILFFLTLAINIPIFLITKKIKKYSIHLLVIFTLYLIFHSVIGLYSNAPLYRIFEDIKPLTYFYSLIFFYNNIRELSDIKYVIRILKITSVIMAVLYLIVYVLMNFNLINYPEFYDALSAYSEFAFRGSQAIFYKGFLFMCVGFFFFFNENTIRSKFIALIIFAAIILTFTRGFVLALIITYLLYILFLKKINIKSVFISAIAICFLISILNYFGTQDIGNKEESNNVRLTTISQVYERTDYVSALVGHGFGIGVPIRDIHMEISYLEIFHKQGIIGLILWLYLFILIVRFYNKAVENGNLKYAKPLLLASIFVFIQSFTNPYMNNPIGMSMLIISIVSLNILGTKKKGEYDIRLHTNI